jgi:hypothetical protein
MGQVLEVCANCGREIGQLETAAVFREHVVCVACKRLLDEQEPPVAKTLDYQARTPSPLPRVLPTKLADRPPEDPTTVGARNVLRSLRIACFIGAIAFGALSAAAGGSGGLVVAAGVCAVLWILLGLAGIAL